MGRGSGQVAGHNEELEAAFGCLFSQREDVGVHPLQRRHQVLGHGDGEGAGHAPGEQSRQARLRRFLSRFLPGRENVGLRRL